MSVVQDITQIKVINMIILTKAYNNKQIAGKRSKSEVKRLQLNKANQITLHHG